MQKDLIQKKAIVLKAHVYSESDLIVSLLCNDGSLKKLFARSAKNSRKRFGGGVLEPTHYIDCSIQDRKQSMSILQEAKLIKDFSGIRSDYDRLQTALQLVNWCEKFAKEDLECPEMFHLLGNALSSAQSSKSLNLLSLQFQAKLLATQGYMPSESLIHELLKIPIQDHETIQLSHHDLKISQELLRKSLKEVI